MRTLLLLALLCAPWPTLAQADTPKPRYIYESPSGTEGGALYEEPCQAEVVLQYIPEQFREDAKRATGRHGGIDWAACYVIIEQTVFFVWEDGGLTRIAVHRLKEPL